MYIYGIPLPIIIVGIIVLIVILYIWFTVKDKINVKKGNNSEEGREIDELIQKVIPDADAYSSAYSTWETKSRRGNSTITEYNYYAIAFKKDVFWYVPLSYAGGAMSYTEPVCIKTEELGAVNGKKGEVWAELFDKEHKELISVCVNQNNTKDDKYHPVNIQQLDKSILFEAYIQELMETVNTANHVEVSGIPGKVWKLKKKK